MSWKSITKAVTKPFKQAGKAINWTDIRGPVMGLAAGAATGGLLGAAGAIGGIGALSGTTVGAIGGGALGSATGMQIDNAHKMSKAQRAADARAAQEADNPVIAPEQAVGGSLLDVDEQAQEDVTTRKRRRTQVSQSTSRGLTRRLGGHSMLN